MSSYSSLTKTPAFYARLTGVFYLLIIILAGFSTGYVRSSLIVPGDSATTVSNIMESLFLFRLGFAFDLTAFALDLAVSVLLYVLLRPVDKTLALVSAAFRAIAHPAIATVNLLNHYAAIHLVDSSSIARAFSPEQLNELVAFFLNLHWTGYLVAGVPFGVHMILLGILVVKADYFPSILGIVLAIAGGGYLVESFGDFMWPGHEGILIWFVAVPAGIGELAIALWLLIKGVDMKKWNAQRESLIAS